MERQSGLAASSEEWQIVRITPGYELRYRWNSDRERLNRSEVYQALKNSDGLLSESFLKCASDLVDYDRRIEESLYVASVFARAFKSRRPLGDVDFLRLVAPLTPEGKEKHRTRSQARPTELDLVLKVLQGRITKQDLRSIMNRVLAVITEVSELIADKEVELQSAVGNDAIRFCSGGSAYVCECRTVQVGRKRPCDACGKPPKGFPFALNRVDPALIDILTNNRWLELAVARLFDRTGFETLVGPLVLGTSGAEHEVDIVAYDSAAGLVLCSEVSVGKGNLSEMADLLVRNQDIHFHGITLVTLKGTDEFASRFARAHGVGLFAEIRLHAKELTSWAKNLRSSHESISKAVQSSEVDSAPQG